MKPSGWLCGYCRVELLKYDIGFDDGAQCPKCKMIYELHELRVGAPCHWKPPIKKDEP